MDFDEAARKSRREILFDKDIREPLFDFLEERFGKIRIFEEKRMGGSRADVVMVTPTAVVGIEIKSDADSYARLKTQIEDYDSYFDRNYIVVGTSHAHHVEAHVPEYWGIVTVEQENGQPDFYLLREAVQNPNRTLRNKLSMLWRPELSHILKAGEMPAYPRKSKAFVVDKILQRIPEALLNEQISEELFERDYSTILAQINEYRMAHGKKKRRRTKKKQRKYKPL